MHTVKARRIVIFAATLACALLLGTMLVSAQKSEDVGEVKMTTSKTKTESGMIKEVPPSAKAAAPCVSMALSITEGGHRWNVDATNNCGRILQCNVTVNLRTSTGLNTTGTCNPAVNPGTSRVCSASNAQLQWVSAGGSFSCS